MTFTVLDHDAFGINGFGVAVTVTVTVVGSRRNEFIGIDGDENGTGTGINVITAVADAQSMDHGSFTDVMQLQNVRHAGGIRHGNQLGTVDNFVQGTVERHFDQGRTRVGLIG